jgi:hypothetical protein
MKGDGVLACENKGIDESPKLWRKSKQWRAVHVQTLALLDIAIGIDEKYGDVKMIDALYICPNISSCPSIVDDQ